MVNRNILNDQICLKSGSTTAQQAEEASSQRGRAHNWEKKSFHPKVSLCSFKKSSLHMWQLILQTKEKNSLFLAVQNSSIGDLVTQSVTHSLTNWVTFTFAIQRAILETCDHWDIWSDRFLKDFQNFGRFLEFCLNCNQCLNCHKSLGLSFQLSKCWTGHVSSSLWSNVSKVTSLLGHSVMSQK